MNYWNFRNTSEIKKFFRNLSFLHFIPHNFEHFEILAVTRFIDSMNQRTFFFQFLYSLTSHLVRIKIHGRFKTLFSIFLLYKKIWTTEDNRMDSEWFRLLYWKCKCEFLHLSKVPVVLVIHLCFHRQMTYKNF